MKLFWVDEKRGIKKTYADLIHDLNMKTGSRRYIYYKNPYDVYLEILYSIAVGNSVELLDSDFSGGEIESLGIDHEELYSVRENKQLEIKDMDDLNNKINLNSKNWSLTIYTSGTTGRPKKISHRLSVLTRNVKIRDRYSNDVWAFAYNPTHYAGLQVFFQAFFNSNPIIYMFDSEKSSFEEVLLTYQVTNISATPTYYRTVIPYIQREIESMKSVTLGGEKYDPMLENKLKQFFPKARVINIYASTEAGSLLSASGEIFEIKESIRPYIRISEINELLIHKDLLGYSDELQLTEDWYHTGDIVEVMETNKIKFSSRKTEMINIGGYKVNPHEVEDEIRKIDGVIDVTVKPRSNKITGNILMAEVVKSEHIDAKELEIIIRQDLKKQLQEWKIPRIIRYIEEVEKSRTGKKVRT